MLVTTLDFAVRNFLASQTNPGVKIVAETNDRSQSVLAARRSEQMSLPGMWEFPGGKIEAGETPEEALAYHLEPRPGKFDVVPSTPMATQRDLSLAYSPGVAVPVQAIADRPETAYDYTVKGNMVAVISNGTAILGLGNLGALASKPVMEGKAVLFKRFADVDSIDIELATEDPDKFIEAVALMEPTFGGINLEDIKAPECFIVEKLCRETMNIPVFHDDQHGTAIVVLAALRGATTVLERDLTKLRVVISGAGAAGVACANILLAAGIDDVIVLDSRRRPVGWYSLKEAARMPRLPDHTEEDISVIDRRSTINDALDSMLASTHGGVLVTGRRDEFLGVVTFEAVTDHIRAASDPDAQEATS